MNSPWNRFPSGPSTAPFSANVGTSARPLRPSGGILGHLSQISERPWTDLSPAAMASDALERPVKQSWDYPWPYQSPLETSYPETLNSLAAWHRIHFYPLPFGFRHPHIPSDSLASIDRNGQSSSAHALGFPSASNVPGQPPVVALPSDGWERSLPMTSLQPTRVGSFAPTIEFPNSGSHWKAAPTAPGVGSMPGSDDGAKNDPRILSDATPDYYWIPGADYVADGHHENPRANYKGLHAKYKGMPPETQKVFDEAKTGKLLLHSIDGRRHEFDALHRQYNAATGELLLRFMKENNIADRPDLITPDHARAVLKAIAESEDPRIQYYRNFIRLHKMFPWLRSGARGSE